MSVTFNPDTGIVVDDGQDLRRLFFCDLFIDGVIYRAQRYAGNSQDYAAHKRGRAVFRHAA